LSCGTVCYPLPHAQHWGGSGRGSRRSQLDDGRKDLADDAFSLRPHIVVPEAQDGVAERCQPSVALEIVLALGMLAAVDFDHQLEARAAEVGEVVADGMLAPEVDTLELSAAQVLP
jgi:hypothetical protein